MPNKLDLTGQRFGRLTAIKPGNGVIDSNGHKHTTWICVCDCNPSREIEVKTVMLRQGHTQSCGCLYKEKVCTEIDLTGKTFGRWTVLKRGHRSKANKYYWLCECSCEKHTIKEVLGESLRNGKSTSCGCYVREHNGQLSRERKKYNTYDLSNSYGIGYTLKGDKFIFDKEDYDLISHFLWRLSVQGYVVATDPTNRRRTLWLHRVVTQITDSHLVIDHCNHDKTDNRKINLRITTPTMNIANSVLNKNNTSGHTGVYWDKNQENWMASITVNKQVINLGRYKNIQDAVRARKEAEDKYFGEYSYDNSMKLAAKHIILLGGNDDS